jgi:hypothetical protein
MRSLLAKIPGWVTEDLIKILSWFLRLRRRDVPTSVSVTQQEARHGTTPRR